MRGFAPLPPTPPGPELEPFDWGGWNHVRLDEAAEQPLLLSE